MTTKTFNYTLCHTTHKSYMDKIDQANINFTILLMRDPRDLIISTKDFLNKKTLKGIRGFEPRENMVKLFANDLKEKLGNKWEKLSEIKQLELINIKWFSLSDKEKIMALIEHKTLINEFDFMKKIMNNYNPVHLISYENLIDDNGCRADAIYDLARYLQAPISYEECKRIAKISYGNKLSWTFNKGTVGRWKKEFDEEIVDFFKQYLGDLLIEWGYESDYNWQ